MSTSVINPSTGDLIPQGGQVIDINEYAGDITLTLLDQVVLCDATSGEMTVTLPEASTVKAKAFRIKKIDVTGNNVIIVGNGSQQIDLMADYLLTAQFDAIDLVSDGIDEWWIV